MNTRTFFGEGWAFAPGFQEAWRAQSHGGQAVCLPHNAADLPWNYGDERTFQRPFTYQRVLAWDPSFEGHDVVVHFEAAMADAHVWVNGALVARHADGYTPFEADLTAYLIHGDNLITVRIDGTENGDIPPFGGRIDYLTYAGIYRDVWLDVRPQLTVANVKIEVHDPLGDAPTPVLHIDVSGPAAPTDKLSITLEDPSGAVISDVEVGASAQSVAMPALQAPRLWTLDDPALYRATVTASSGHVWTSRFGIRQAQFTPSGFLLNGTPLQIRGLNRHQSFAHVGYALGPEAQARDADILKYELGLNLVRSSHYPPSKGLLERCDEIGLLVFEEIPGWQHIGGDAFKAQSLKNVEAMIRRDWNHPSIILWGVRINESPDDDAFYAQTNALARQLDPTRQTGGVRCIPNSTLLEDVYTMNDFVLGEDHLPGINRPRTPLRDQREVTGLPAPVPYMVTEYNGHMYPTKIFDGEERHEEHVLRHLDVLNAAYGDRNISGSIGWCMADYNTHADFGSGDRICYHGVMSMSRLPKFAAFGYASQGFCADEKPMLEPATHWSFGDRKVGGVFPLVILTNCDAVSFQFDGEEPHIFTPARERFPHLPNPPVVIEPTDFPPEKLIVWGESWRAGTLIGLVGGQEVIRRTYVADPLPTHLDMRVDPLIRPSDPYHDRLVRITARDQAGNRLPFLMDQLAITVTGDAQIQGPSTVPLIGGVASFYLRTRGAGEVKVSTTTVSGVFVPQALTL